MAWDRLRQTYDRVADRYAAQFVDELGGKPRDRELLDAFAAAVGDPILDVGCGPGQIGAYMRQRGHVVFGADVSAAMAEAAATRLDSVVVADLRALPLRTASIAGVLAFYSLIHVRRAEVAAALGELARVLRPGGRVLLAVHEGDGEIAHDEFLGLAVPIAGTLFDLDELVTIVDGAGLPVVHAERRDP